MVGMSILDPIELGPLTLQPIETQAVGGHITIELATGDGEPNCWADDGGNYINVPITVWERAQASRAPFGGGLFG